MDIDMVKILEECKDMVECWSDYASEYYREKHDLNGDLEKIDKWIKNFEVELGRYCPNCNRYCPNCKKQLSPESVTFEEKEV